MKKGFVVILAFMLLAACSAKPSNQPETEKPKSEITDKGNATDNESEVDSSQEENTTDTTEENTESTEETDNETDSEGEEPQEGEEGAAIHIDFEPYTESFSVNGVLVGDTRKHVIETLGEPFKKYEGDVRYDYTFQDVWYGETLSIDFDDPGVNYIQVESITEKGKLLEDAFIQSFAQDFNGQIFKATDQMLKDFGATSLFVFFVHEDSILVALKRADDNYGVARTYMVTHIHRWAWSRGWNMEMFENDTLFTKVTADIAIADQ
ncbi:hypothetical protein [Pseudalkalibacillus sp. SCS-8]|uniref:hypothetical protein n=1 Tax=Pseudalkalibacillus nanhaiensis TaxID=3115291 RepID=UPI0032DBB800